MVDIFLTDSKQHVIVFPDDMQQGSNIQYSYQNKYEDIAFLPILQIPNYNETREIVFTYKHPKSYRVEFELFFPADTIAYHVKRTSDKETSISFPGIPFRRHVPYFEYNHIQAAVLPRVYIGATEITKATPENFSNWYSKELRHMHGTGSTPLSLPAGLQSGEESDLEYARKVYDYVKSEIRYIADVREKFAYIPRPASSVLTNGYGDCKDKAFLISQMAEQMNIPIHMALISTEPRPQFEGVHIWQYNHVICALEGRDTTYYFDPTSTYSPFHSLPEQNVGKETLILNSKYPRKHVTPIKHTSTSLSVQINVHPDSLKRARALITLRNDFFAYGKRAKASLTGVRFENAITTLLGDIFYRLSLDYFQTIEETENSLKLHALADLSKFFIESPTKRYVPRTPFIVFDGDIIQRRKDSFPVAFATRPYYELTIDFQSHISAANIQPLHMQDNAGSYFRSSASNPKEGIVRFTSVFHQQKKQFIGIEKESFLDFCDTYLSGKKEMFILEKGETDE